MEYRTILLTQGKIALVDATDYEWLAQWKWRAVCDLTTGNFYAQRSEQVGINCQAEILMHRQILGLERGDPRKGDHRDNQNTLDNRRSNLRIATASQSNCNRSKPKNNSSGFKGVSFVPRRNKWRAQIYKDGRSYFLGHFDSPELAHAAYCSGAVKHYGEFARVV